MLDLTRLLSGLALKVRGSCEGRIRLQLVQLSSKEGLLLIHVALQRRNVGELVREVLRGGCIVNNSMGDRLGVGSGCIEGYSCRGQRVKRLLALRCEAGFQPG